MKEEYLVVVPFHRAAN